MERIAMIAGIALCGLSVFALVASPVKQPAVFVPLLFGIPLLLCGVVSLNPHRRRGAMRLAAIVATAALVSGGLEAGLLFYRAFSGEDVSPRALVIAAGMMLIGGATLAAYFVNTKRR